MKELMIKTLLLALLAIPFCGCVRYVRCAEKFATERIDTVLVAHTDTVAVPAATATFSVPTDSTPLTQIVQQGRAKTTLVRTAKTTTVKADCLPDTIYKPIRLKVPVKTTVFTPNVSRWKWAGIGVLIGLIVGVILSIIVISKRI